MLICNTHVHTPHSFSSFTSVDELVSAAAAVSIGVLGINDDIMIDGFKEFETGCREKHIYPIFNITLPMQCTFEHHGTTGHRTAANNHACLLIGKALQYPATLGGDSRNLLASLWKASQDRMWKLIDALNDALQTAGCAESLDYGIIRSGSAKSSVYPYHIALALYDLLLRQCPGDDHGEMLNTLFSAPPFEGDHTDRESSVENIHRMMLASPLFEALPPVEPVVHLPQAKQVILQAGGIPCFHCSFNEDDEWMKESEGPELLVQQLSAKGIHAVEFFPGETSLRLLETFMRYLYHHNFCVTMGSGWLTVAKQSLLPVTADGKMPDENLLAMNYEGTCILAAHQELHKQNRRGFVDEAGKRLVSPENLQQFITVGDEIIRSATGS
jgi:hypothetical protein